jgi:hypothetical protein
MKKEELDRLLKKFYEGHSTPGEEKLLRAFFSGQAPEGYESEKALFGYLMDSSEIPEPSSLLEQKIFEGIDSADNKKRNGLFRRNVFVYSGVAAAVCILIGAWFFLTHESKPKDTFSDPELAYAETIKVLYEVSSRLNQGTMAMEPVTRINRSTTIVEKNLKSLDYIQNAVDLIKQPDGK